MLISYLKTSCYASVKASHDGSFQLGERAGMARATRDGSMPRSPTWSAPSLSANHRSEANHNVKIQ